MIASRFLDDPVGLQQVYEAIDLLAGNPYTEAKEYGHANLRRIRIGRYRVFYEVQPDEEIVEVKHLGRGT